MWQVRTEVGARVAEGDELVILESMKMEIPVVAPVAGTVSEVRVVPEDQVHEGDVVAELIDEAEVPGSIHAEGGGGEILLW